MDAPDKSKDLSEKDMGQSIQNIFFFSDLRVSGKATANATHVNKMGIHFFLNVSKGCCWLRAGGMKFVLKCTRKGTVLHKVSLISH